MQRVASIVARFAELAKATAQTARQLETAGVPPSEALLQELIAVRQEFTDLSGSLQQAARGLSVPAAEIATLGDLDRLARAIVQAKELEEKRAALAVLDRVPALAHRDERPSGLLETCQATARETRAAIANATSLEAEGQSRAWAEAVQPFADLLTLVEGQENLADDRTAFGRPLAMAAVRAKLVMGPSV